MFKDGEWQEVAPLNQPRSYFSIGILKNCIYVIGGYSGTNQLINTIEKYNTDTNTWEILQLDPSLKILVGILVLESPDDPTKLWLIGGSDGEFAST